MSRSSRDFKANPLSPLSKLDIAICERIQRLRVANGYTQKELAVKCSVSVSNIKQIETGMQIPSLTVLRAVVKLYNVSHDFLIDGKR